MPKPDAPLYLLAGPTASGKSALALEWVQKTGGLIVNADSMQHYRDVPILTARPTLEDETAAPHAFYGHLGPQDQWSTGDWVRAVMPLIGEAKGGGQPLCLVGGTGLYFLSLIRGLAHIPEVNPVIRAGAEALYLTEGEQVFRDRLAAVDPEAARRIAPNDQQRLTRAWEVWQATGIALSDWQAHTEPLLMPEDYQLHVVLPDREWLYARCDQRLTNMWQSGAPDEVKTLMNQGLEDNWPIMRVLGLREAMAQIKGEITSDAALTLAQQKTRNYAKRQMTWFRNQM